MSKTSMTGVWTALVTPFDSGNQLDLPTFRNLLRIQVESKIQGVIVCATTGEAPTLSEEEKKKLIATAVEELKICPIKVYAGVGTYQTAETVRLAKWASDIGVDGLTVVTPYYNKPSQKGLEVHFRAIADAVDCDVMLYNVPGRTGVTLSPETIATLSTHPHITSLKESTGNLAAISDIFAAISNQGGALDILCGDDFAFVPFSSIGATGVVSVASNLIPKAMVSIQNAIEAQETLEAQRLHHYYYPLFRDLFIDSNPVPIKYAMNYLGLLQPHVRMPLVPLSPLHKAKLEATLGRCGIKKQLLAREPLAS
jgi:4-hydroxy-tetrahydrodipicolinate synthase